MDYPGWELERQRTALAALLLGGGTAGEEAAARDGENRTAEAGEIRAAGRRGGKRRFRRAEEVSDSAGEHESREAGYPGAWEAAVKSGQVLREAPPPASAWEEITGTEPPEDGGWAGGFSAAGAPSEPDGADFTGGGTGVWEKSREAPPVFPEAEPPEPAAGKQVLRRLRNRPELTGGADGEALRFPAEPGQREARRTGVSSRQSRTEAVFSGGGMGQEAWKRDGLPVLRETETGGTASRGVGREAAPFQAEDGARAVSRAVQRDSRRYDGGFILY